MKDAERIVTALLDGRFTDWMSDRWGDIKHAAGEVTGIGRDEYGMGKAEKGFRPKYVSHQLPATRKRPPIKRTPPPGEGHVWDIG